MVTTYTYRWTKSAITYSDSSYIMSTYTFSNASINNQSIDIVMGDRYSLDSSSGTYSFSGTWYQTYSSGQGAILSGSVCRPSTIDTTIVEAVNENRLNVRNNKGSLVVTPVESSTVKVHTAQQTSGSFIEYVYSTNPSAYPNGGVQGGYYYSGRIVSSTDTTYDLSLHNVDNATGAGSYHEGDQVTINAGEREGYEFFSWTSGDIKISNPKNSTITFSMPAKDITLAANWASQNLPSTGGGGNSMTTLGQLSVGSIVKVKESGVPVDYIVVNQGIPQNSPLYDESCNGTWLLRKDIYANAVWDAGNQNAYGPSDVNTNYLPNTILPLYDVDFQNVIKQVKIPYVNGTGNSPVASGDNGLSTKLFLLGGYEVGWTSNINSNFPIDGAVLDYFENTSNVDNKRIAYFNSSVAEWFIRSSNISSVNYVWIINSEGYYGYGYATNLRGIRPAFILPTNLLIDSDNNILSQSFTITVPQVFMQGQPIPISWTPWTLSTGGTVTYTIERNTGSGWTQVATDVTVTNYNDTAQTGWTQVQYQITPVIDGTNGPSVQSAIIPGVESAVLAISGIDQNLGTITSNVQYTVVSNTGNQISLTRTVNGAQVVTIQVESGFSYNIPIADLPTGTGTIVITASVEDSSQEIQTATRTWTYYKTPINIPSTGGVAQLIQNGQNIWPTTIADAVQAPVYLGGNLNAALNKLGQAALYNKPGISEYNKVTIDLSKVNVGDEILLPENGKMVPFYVGSLNYEPTLNTSGNRVLLIRKYIYNKQKWNNTNNNYFGTSSIYDWLNISYLSYLDDSYKNLVSPNYIYYTSSINTITSSNIPIFLLSLTEISNYPYPTTNVEGTFLGISNLLKIAYEENGTPVQQWTRTKALTVNNMALTFEIDGNEVFSRVTNSLGVRPCFTLPNTFTHTYYVDTNNLIHSEQQYTTASSITDVFGYDVPICQYETGSYTGTGMYGSSNPNTLTFSFEPKIVYVFGDLSAGYATPYFCRPADSAYIGVGASLSTLYQVSLDWGDNSISWYSTGSAVYQLNQQNVPYNYIAIG